MNSKNEVFEYLIDQLRQQLQVVDVVGEIERWSIDRSIAGRGNYTDEENAIIDAYIGLEHNPYKQQCEDLAHEVLSLKNQLRDMSGLVDELLGTITLMNEGFNRATGRGGHLPKGKSYVVGEHGPEQSGCRKEDVQECEHSWIIMPGLFLSEGNPNNVPGSELCCKCGKREWDVKGYKPKADTQECSHNWRFVNGKAPAVCINCGMTKSSKCEHEWQSYGVGFPCMCIKCGLKK